MYNVYLILKLFTNKHMGKLNFDGVTEKAHLLHHELQVTEARAYSFQVMQTGPS